MNKQLAEKRWWDPDGRLEVFHVWKTIQGEGPFVGMPAVFVRLAGCNLQCSWCDTDYTSRREFVGTDELLGRVLKEGGGCSLVVLTGGEPLRQNVIPFIELVLAKGLRIQIETNGLCYTKLPAEVSVVCSPKTNRIDDRMWPQIDALKYVVQFGCVGKDGLPTGLVRPPGGWEGDVYIQPLADGSERHAQVAVELCLRFGYRLSLQIHKIVGLE